MVENRVGLDEAREKNYGYWIACDLIITCVFFFQFSAIIQSLIKYSLDKTPFKDSFMNDVFIMVCTFIIIIYIPPIQPWYELEYEQWFSILPMILMLSVAIPSTNPMVILQFILIIIAMSIAIHKIRISVR